MVIGSVEDWHSLGSSGLEVLSPVCDRIKNSSEYTTEDEKRRALIAYYIQTMPDASWKGLAAGLYRREEKTALEALKEYLGDRQGEF